MACMKNGLLIWNVILTLLVGYLLISKFTGSKRASVTKSTLSDSTNRANAPIRIAYFEMDSVAANFAEVKKLKEELSQKETQNNNELNALTQKFRDRYNYYQKQMESGTMTEAQSIAASEEMKQMEENIRNRKITLEQEYNDFYMRRQSDIKTKIENFIRDYNKDGRYNYVLSDDPGLFYYQDTSFNITSDVVSGLNRLYPGKKKQ